MAGPAYQCRMCGKCCHGKGGIKVTEEDIRAQAEFVGLDVEDYRERYIVLRHGKMEIGTREDGACHFLADKVCGIHPVKPAICALWPWLPGALKEEMGFLSLKQDCPGVDREATWEDFKAQYYREHPDRA